MWPQTSAHFVNVTKYALPTIFNNWNIYLIVDFMEKLCAEPILRVYRRETRMKKHSWGYVVRFNDFLFWKFLVLFILCSSELQSQGKNQTFSALTPNSCFCRCLPFLDDLWFFSAGTLVVCSKEGETCYSSKYSLGFWVQ